MIIARKQGNDILKGGETRIAFAVNTEGHNDAGFSGLVSRLYWPELANAGEHALGSVLKKETNLGITFYALVCHSLKEGWKNQEEIICKCFDSIDGDEPIASISIGTGFIGTMSGADFSKIKAGMQRSKKQIILY